MKTYTTEENDVLDKILWDNYGRSDLLIDVLEANRKNRLSFEAAILPAGIKILLPTFEEKTQNNYKPLWA